MKIKKAIITSSVLICFFWLAWIAIPQMPDSGEPPRFYATQNRDDFKIIFKKALSNAKKLIDIQIYSLTDPKIIKTLNTKAATNIPITISIDKKQRRAAARTLNPQVKLYTPHTKGLMHRKIVIIDGSQVWLGSTNMTTESLKIHDNLIIGMHSPQLAEAIKNEQHKTIAVGDQNIEYWPLPKYGDQALEQVINLIKEAKKTVKVAMFTWTHPRLAQAVIDAHQRGVKVYAVIDNNSSKGASRKAAETLKAAGIDTRCNQGIGLLHHKLAYIDDKILITGSANWTKAAFKKNRECIVIIPELNKTQIKFINRLWKNTLLEAQQIH